MSGASRPRGDGAADVVFVLVPYVAVERPSIALGILTASLAQAGISARTIHGNLLFAERIGVLTYEEVNCSDITLQIGEWTFSEAAFRERARDVDAYLGALHGGSFPQKFKDEMLRLRVMAGAFIEDLAAQVVAARPRLVGCSSTFQQHCASLALLRRVRELEPGIVTMMGGANCEASMGVVTHAEYPWVDFVVSGEADKLLPDLCELIFEHGRDVPADRLPYGVLGPATRADGGAARKDAPRALIEDLDELPIPDFDDYFEHLERSPLREFVLPALPLETSRGCWWGAKHHCTFCGLNGAGMAFRSKSESRVQDEVRWLSERHGLKKFMAVDNILDTKYFGRLLPALAEMGDMRFLYETKANLSRAQVEMLFKAGVRWIQPGIEALHDDLLSLLKKGCTAAANVQLLKWARTYGIWVVWNHLYGAPGDRAEWYEEIADWLPLITHLQPPSSNSLTRIRFDRFSPYFNSPDAFGLKLVPYGAYGHVYPLDAEQLADQAYFFCHDGPEGATPARLTALMQTWADLFYAPRSTAFTRMSATAPVLSMRDDGERAFIRDTRPCAVSPTRELTPLESLVCRACDAAKSAQRIIDSLRLEGCAEPDEAITAALGRLVEWKIIGDFSGRFLCLATDEPLAPYLGLGEFAAGIALLAPRKKPEEPAPSPDPWATPLREMF